MTSHGTSAVLYHAVHERVHAILFSKCSCYAEEMIYITFILLFATMDRDPSLVFRLEGFCTFKVPDSVSMLCDH